MRTDGDGVMEGRTTRELRIEREGLLARLASAYQRGDLAAFEESMRPDMELTLRGHSRLAGTYHGYEAFARYLEALREVVTSAARRITFEHEGDAMVFRQFMMVNAPSREAEIELRVRVIFHEDERVQSFTVEPQEQQLFDAVIDASAKAS